MSYVDGFVIPLPKKKLAAYRAMAKACSKIWKELGAVAYVECLADDAPVGKLTSFPRSVKLKKGEVVVFSWIVYRSRADRDRIIEKAMNDPRLAKWAAPAAMPFDGKRMIYGGFKPFLEM